MPDTSSNIVEKLRELVPAVHSLKEIGTNKKLAKFGDIVTNFIYSVAKSLIIHRLDQRKVNRTILANALKDANLKEFCKTRSNAHDMANTAEAFIGYMYCKENWSFEHMVNYLQPTLSTYNLEEYTEEIAGATAAFTILLKKIKEELSPKFSV